ncbi:hypothetical protein ACP70R_025383 [Stipagrostis hirtigluma subsp. patula]
MARVADRWRAGRIRGAGHLIDHKVSWIHNGRHHHRFVFQCGLLVELGYGLKGKRFKFQNNFNVITKDLAVVCHVVVRDFYDPGSLLCDGRKGSQWTMLQFLLYSCYNCLRS